MVTVFPKVDTRCPVEPTVCPMAGADCLYIVPTVSPELQTRCPVIRTLCPATIAGCQQTVPTVEPAEKTNCPAIASLCPADVPCGPADIIPPDPIEALESDEPVRQPSPGDGGTVAPF